MSQKKDYSRLSQIDYCIQNYYSRYLAGSVEKTFKDIDFKRKQEVMDNYKYSANLPTGGIAPQMNNLDIAQRIANRQGKWNSKEDDVIAKDIVEKWQKNKTYQRDMGVLMSELYAEIVRRNGGVDKDGKLAVNTYAYFNLRLREAMVKQLARKNVPRNSAEFIASHSFSGSFVGSFLATHVSGSFEEEVSKKANKIYKPNKLEKGAAWVGSEAIDWGMLGGPIGASTPVKAGISVGRTMALDFGFQKGMKLLKGGKPYKTTLEDVSQTLFHDPAASAKIMAGSKAYGRTGTELISRVNDQLSKGHKIKVGRPTFSMEAKTESLKLCKASAGSSKRMLKSMTTFFDRQAIPYNSNARPPQWMAAKTSKQCRAFGSYYYGIAKQCSMERRDGAKVNGKYMTLKAISQRAYDYAHAAVLLDEMTVARKAENARRSQPHSHRSGGHHYSPTSVSQSTPQYQTNGIQPVVDSLAQPATGSYVKQEVNPQLSGWQKGLQNMGLGDFGTLGQNLGYVFAMLPDMLIGMFTGKNQDMRLKDNLLPFASILMGMFTKNKLLKLMFMGMGGMSLLNNAGHAALTQREREEKKVRQYKIYQDEPLNPRIKNPVIKGKSMICEIDGKNLVIQINKDEALYCYEKGLLPLNVLANSVLKAYDKEQSNIASEYDRQQNIQEENRQAVQLR